MPPHRRSGHGRPSAHREPAARTARWTAPKTAKAAAPRADVRTHRSPRPRRDGQVVTKWVPGWSSTTTKRHTSWCDERCRDLGNRNHVARAFAEPTQHGQRRHDRVAVQRTHVLCWAVRDVLHGAGAGRRQLAAAANRAEPVSGGPRHAGAHRVVIHLPDGRFRGRAWRRVRSAALVCADVLHGSFLHPGPGLRVLAPVNARHHHSGQRLRFGVLPGHRLSRPARDGRADRVHPSAAADQDEQVHPRAGHSGDRRLLLLALRRHRVDCTVRHDLFRPMSNRSGAAKRHGEGSKALKRPGLVVTDRSRRRLRRRVSAGLLLLVALAIAGGLAATLTPQPQVAVADESQSALLRAGKQLFDTSCVTCHGANLQGVTGRGPSLIGGGPTVPRNPDGSVAMHSLRGDDVARGGNLFRLNCASCHNFTGKGGALSSGKYAPPLESANETPNPGGYGLGGFGPAPEGMAMWIIGMVGVIAVALWIGSRA